jgi:hypothetical protein
MINGRSFSAFSVVFYPTWALPEIDLLPASHEIVFTLSEKNSDLVTGL